MADSTNQTAHLRRVAAINTDAAGATVRFTEGVVGQLASDHDAFERALHLLRDGLDRRTFVGVRLDDDGTIRKVHWVDNDTPLEIDERDRDCIRIFFACHAGLYRLRRDHREYPRLFALLHKAWREQKRLWFLSERELDLVDLQPVDAAPPSANATDIAPVEIGRLRDALVSDSPP